MLFNGYCVPARVWVQLGVLCQSHHLYANIITVSYSAARPRFAASLNESRNVGAGMIVGATYAALN